MSIENYFSESSMKDVPRKGLRLVLKEGSVTNSKIRDGSVTTDKLADEAVNARKIGKGAVLNDNIADNTIDLGKFNEELRQIIKAASGMPDDLVSKMQDISNEIAELQRAAFPMTLGMSVTSDAKVENVEVNFSIKWKESLFVPDTLEISKNNTILTNVPKSYGTVSSKIETNKETFEIKAAKEGQAAQYKSITRYLCYYGGNPSSTSLTAGMLDSLNKVYALDVSFNPTVTVKDGEYIWLVVPNDLSISSIKSFGIDVPFEASESFVVPSLGAFKSYRTTNALEASTWNLIIS